MHEYNRELTKEEIKAIRIVMGFNSDLRIKLDNVNRTSIWHFIDDNRFGLLGVNFGMSRPEIVDFYKWKDYEDCIYRMVTQVINGR